MKRKIADILLILFISINLTGCYNYREINKMTFATSVIFDKDEHNEVVLYIDCVRPYRDANESSDKGRRVMYKLRIEHADADKIIYKFKYGFELEKFITSILTTFDSHVTFTVWECDDNE